ncbi:hypothetical protein VTH06DRAFT_8605 [Thermothelomyces fergusii]
MADWQQDQRSAGLLNLSSNNPFRNRAVSPASPVSPFDDPPPRPVSRNPFLDPAITGKSSSSNIRSVSETMASDKRPSLTAEEIFGSLTLDDSTTTNDAPRRPSGAKPPPPPPPGRRGPPPPLSQRDGVAGPNRRPPPPTHRPTRSQEEALRARKTQEREGRPDPSRSPQRRQERRPRRNSDSSIIDANMTEEERRQRELRRRERERERERRHREHRDKKPVSRKLDIIDQLDATSIYGTGIFHHDGPFDALNPHRNRQGSRRAPMQAFPEGSLNNTIGGIGPLNSRPDHSAFMGHHDDEAFMEWSRSGRDGSEYSSHKETPVFDPLSRGTILHGDQSLGLGTSTFLEGTPAARAVIQKSEEERALEAQNESLQRKKSLAHRIRNINRGNRDFQASGRLTNPDAGSGSRRSPSNGGPASASSERSPFFSEFGSGKGEDEFTVRKMDTNGSIPFPSSPRSGPGLERRSTADATGSEDAQPKAGGLLGRMKSLKGRRQRPNPAPGGAELVPPPGTAV